jgi:hypothetical protein
MPQRYILIRLTSTEKLTLQPNIATKVNIPNLVVGIRVGWYRTSLCDKSCCQSQTSEVKSPGKKEAVVNFKLYGGEYSNANV